MLLSVFEKCQQGILPKGSYRLEAIRHEGDFSGGSCELRLSQGFEKTDSPALKQIELARCPDVNWLIYEEQRVLDQPLDISRELLLISKDPYDEVARTFTFMNKQPRLLQDTRVQEAMEFHLFRYGRLPSQMIDNPSVIADGAQIIQKLTLRFARLKDSKTAIYCCRLGLQLADFVRGRLVLPDYRQILLAEIVPRFRDDPKVLAQCYHILLASYARWKPEILLSNRLTVAKDLYRYLFTQEQASVPRAWEAKQLYTLLLPHISSLLDKNLEARKEVLDACVAPFGSSSEWRGSFPHFESDDYTVDLRAIRILNREGDLFVSVPEEVLLDPTFRHIFKGSIESCSLCESSGLLRVNGDKDDEIEIEPNALVYYRKINGLKCRHIPKSKAYYCNRIQDPRVECWAGPVGADKQYLYFMLHGRLELCRDTLQTSGDGCYTPEYRVKRNKGCREQFLVLHPNIPSYLLSIEEADHRRIECWVDSGTKVQEINLEQAGLTFFGRELEGKTRLYSKQFPGFYLAEPISLPRSMTRALSLQNHEGSCKVILCGTGHIVFDVVDGELASNQLLGQLTLLYHLLASEMYIAAQKQLESINPLRNLNREAGCHQLAESIYGLLKGREKHPIATAVFLHFVVFLERNTLRYPLSGEDLKPDEELAKPVAHRYWYVYCANRQSLGGFLLGNKAEQSLIEYLIANGQEDFLRNRISFFRRETPKLGRRAFRPLTHRCRHEEKLSRRVLMASYGSHKTVHFDKGLIKSEKWFAENFFQVYYKAIQKKKSFDWFWDLHAGHAGSPYYECLRRVARSPESFPGRYSIRDFSALLSRLEALLNAGTLSSHQVASSSQQALSRNWDLYRHQIPVKHGISQLSTPQVDLSSLDRGYDHFLKSLVKEYFTWTEEAVSLSKEELDSTSSDLNVCRQVEAENADLRYYRHQQSSIVRRYSLAEGKQLSQLRASLATFVSKLSQRLKTSKAALIWYLGKQVHGVSYWSEIKAASLGGRMDARFNAAVLEHLVHSTRLNQITTLVSVIRGIEHRDERFLPQVVNALLMTRAYAPSQGSIHRLWFEEANKFLYRESQLLKLDELTPTLATEVLGEMPTGFGKTLAIVPSINYRRAHQNVLIFNTHPSTLEMTNASDLKGLMSRCFGMSIDRLVFNRATPISYRSLAYLYQDLLQHYSDGTPISTKSESLRAFQLHTILLLHGSTELGPELRVMLDILRLIRRVGWSTVDESHLTLDPFDKLIYTLGDPSHIPVDHLLFIQEFSDFLTEGALDAALGIRENKQAFLPKGFFAGRLVAILMDYFESKFGIPKARATEFQDFLLGAKQEIPRWIKEAPNRQLLALAKGLSTRLLEVALKGSVNEKYGLSKFHVSDIEFAIPFLMANSPKETRDNPTQYKNPHETLLKTYFTYLSQGLTLSQVKKMITALQSQALEQAVDGIALSETPASLLFDSLVKDPKYFLCALSDVETIEIAEILRRKKAAVFYYVQTYVHQQIKIYPKTIVSTVHNFRSMFHGCLSFSATPQDAIAHSFDTYFVPMRGTAGQVTHLLLTKCKDPKSLHGLKGQSPMEALAESTQISGENPRLRATIDIGAYFKGLDNHGVASRILCDAKEAEDVLAVVFFDESEKCFKVMDQVTGKVQVFSNSQVDPERRKTYYDQSRSFGSDVKQGIDAAALLMTNKNSTKSDVGQGAGRMREWHKDQMVEIAYPQEMEGDIKALIAQWIENEVRRKEQKNYLNIIQQMDDQVRARAFDAILDAEPQDVLGTFRQHQALFITEDSSDPWELYAELPQEVDTKKYLREYLAAKKLDLDPAIWEDMILPPKVQVKNVGMGMECEVLLELNTEAEVEEQLASNDQKHRRRRSVWSPSLNLFSLGWERPTRQFTVGAIRNIALSYLPSKRKSHYDKIGLTSAISLIAGATLIGVACLVNQRALRSIVGAAALLFIGAGIEGIFWVLRTVKPYAEVFSVPRYLKEQLPGPVAKGSELFSPQLQVSKNVFPNITSVSDGIFPCSRSHDVYMPQVPFRRDQKPLFSVLVIRDETPFGRAKFTVTLIDQDDSVFFHEKLQEDLIHRGHTVAGRRRRKVGLYDLWHNKFTVAGKNGFSDEDIDDPMFWNLIAQAKFLNGQITFQEKEMEHFGAHLDAKAKKIGRPIIQSLYMNHILNNRPLYKQALCNSSFHPWIKRALLSDCVS